ncbi:hypothetical protein SRHO_G00063310 [Serrasalmus rhombeus]
MLPSLAVGLHLHRAELESESSPLTLTINILKKKQLTLILKTGKRFKSLRAPHWVSEHMQLFSIHYSTAASSVLVSSQPLFGQQQRSELISEWSSEWEKVMELSDARLDSAAFTLFFISF